MRSAKRHGFDLIVSDVDHRRLQQFVQLGDLDAGRDAQRRIEIGERFVEQEDVGLAHDRAADGDTLALSARQGARVAREQRLELQHARGLGDAAIHFRARDAGEFQAERHVLAHVHVRIERVGLEHHRDFALGRGERVDQPTADVDVARRRRVEPGDHAQQRRFSAARRPDQHDEFTVLDPERDVAEDARLAVILGEIVDAQVGHGREPLCESSEIATRRNRYAKRHGRACPGHPRGAACVKPSHEG